MTTTRRYTFKLYPRPAQAAAMREQCKMVADLWNALLQRHEDIQRRTVQRQVWFDADGKRHVGVSVHNPTWISQRKKNGEIAVVTPDNVFTFNSQESAFLPFFSALYKANNGRPKRFTDYDMQNEITYLCNVMPEWRELSVWCGHRTAQLLDRAFKAFYSRAAKGAGAQSGYPRFKRRDDHDGIPHRFVSGCRLSMDPRGETDAFHKRSWMLYLKGVDGTIFGRGRFPTEVLNWADADVVWRDDGWWVSVCVEVAQRRWQESWARPITVRLNLLDEFALVNGVPETPRELTRAQMMDETLDEMKSERDQRWPRGKRLSDAEREELHKVKRRISRLAAKIARIRRDALHVWTAGVVRRASTLTVVAPPVKPNTQTPRGDEKQWGANVETVSSLNRSTLSQAPALAIAMLKYKAEEAGIRCDIVEDDAPVIATGNDLKIAGKALRRARREHRKAA